MRYRIIFDVEVLLVEADVESNIELYYISPFGEHCTGNMSGNPWKLGLP